MITHNQPLMNRSNVYLPWFICFIAMLFYCFNYFLRSSPNVMRADLIQNFHITASQFGLLSTCYYFAYTPMQIPAGMIYDKFGARFVLFFACVVAVLGLGLFISADSLSAASVGRFLIGLGSAFAYLGVLKLASLWLPPARFATAAGLTTALGMSCALLSQRYLAKTIDAVGYKAALHNALFIGIVLCVIIFFFVKNRPKQTVHNAFSARSNHQPMNFVQLIKAVGVIIKKPQMLLIGTIGCLLYLPALVLLDNWSNGYFTTVYQLSKSEAINIASFTFLGWIIGGPVFGWFSDKIKRRRMPLLLTSAISAVLLTLIFYTPYFSLTQLYFMIFITGFCCGAHPLCFAIGKENNPTALSGTSVAVVNFFIMAGGWTTYIVGLLLDIHTTIPKGADGLPVYSASDYTFALSIVPVGVAFATFLCFFLKETYCESQIKEHEEHRVFIKPVLVSENAPA